MTATKLIQNLIKEDKPISGGEAQFGLYWALQSSNPALVGILSQKPTHIGHIVEMLSKELRTSLYDCLLQNRFTINPSSVDNADIKQEVVRHNANVRKVMQSDKQQERVRGYYPTGLKPQRLCDYPKVREALELADRIEEVESALGILSRKSKL